MLESFNKSLKFRLQEEAKIVDKAKSELINLERKLMKPWPREYYRGKGVRYMSIFDLR